MIKNYYLAQTFLNKSQEELKYFNWKIDKYDRDNMLYVKIMFNDVPCKYIINYNNINSSLDFEDKILIDELLLRIPNSETLIFDEGKLLDDVHKIIVYNNDITKTVIITDENDKFHSSYLPSQYEIDCDIDCEDIIYNIKYHIHGNRVDKIMWERYIKMKKIRNRIK